MFCRSSSWCALVAAALLLLVPSTAEAAPITSTLDTSVTLLSPNTLQKLEDLDFGTIGQTAAGTAIINPITNTESSTGGVLALGGTPHAARFQGVATKHSVVNIKLPNQPVTLTRSGGTETVTVSNFTLDGPSKKVMADGTIFQIRVGATLTVAAAKTPGLYTGTFNVTAQYP
jgi:hypothetical protein